tara:strand:+ start:5328 stop:5954 length:627 start_codon:yes stop_codon:yes gene_type:complete
MDRDNLIALREAIDSFSGLVKTITEPTWEEKQALMLVNQQALQSHAAEIAKDSRMFEASIAAEQAGFLAETADIDFAQAEKYGQHDNWFFSGYGVWDWFTDTARKEKYDTAMAAFEVNHDFYKDNRGNVVQSWAYFGQDGEGVQQAIDQATTAISTLKNYRTAEKWLQEDVDVAKIDNYIEFYEGEIERLQSDPEAIRSQRKLPRANY